MPNRHLLSGVELSKAVQRVKIVESERKSPLVWAIITPPEAIFKANVELSYPDQAMNS